MLSSIIQSITQPVARSVTARRGGSYWPSLAPGEYYLTDEHCNYLTDENGAYLIGKDA